MIKAKQQGLEKKKTTTTTLTKQLPASFLGPRSRGQEEERPWNKVEQSPPGGDLENSHFVPRFFFAFKMPA